MVCRAFSVVSVGLLCSLGILGCGSEDQKVNNPPSFEILADQVGQVEKEISFVVRATDPDGDPLSYSFTSELKDLGTRAKLTPLPSGASFSWTPIASEIGIRAFDFAVSDGQHTIKKTITIDVQATSVSEAAPVFRQPLGSGTTLDVAVKSCVEIPIFIEDADSPGVTIAEEEPVIAGAMLNQDSGLSATWKWCPSADQIDAQDRYTLTLSADDEKHPKTIKSYLIVIRRPQKMGCKGEAPQVIHQPVSVETSADIEINAQVNDDLGIKHEPLLLYALQDPGTPPDIGKMIQLTMKPVSGDTKQGAWKASIPNPVSNQPPGTKANVYYLMVAQDNDDSSGNCDHLTQVPEQGTYSITITTPSGMPTGCAHDLCQTGGALLQSCSSCVETVCKADNFCCANYWDEQCVTSASTACALDCKIDPPKPVCQDDSQEENDSIASVKGKPSLPLGTLNSLKLCPGIDGVGYDTDYYPIQVSSDAEYTLAIGSNPNPDLDLALLRENGQLISQSSLTANSNESLTQCLTPGLYFARVQATGTGEASYWLSVASQPKTCMAACSDDDFEPDNNSTQARFADLDMAPFISQTNSICPQNDDWYKVYLFSGETIRVTLTFSQANSKEDLDVQFYKDSTSLTNCTELDVSGCSETNGQSSTSDEVFTYQAQQSGTYYVVVHGWEGSSNLYDICIGFNETQCPTP
jgi:hypothetical protein